MEANFDENKQVINIQLAEGQEQLVIRHGDAPKMLDQQKPINLDLSGTIGSVAEFLSKRSECFDHRMAHIIVDREKVSIRLVYNEHSEYCIANVYGSLTYHPKFIEFGINQVKLWTPEDLAMTVKMNRAFFANKADNMKLYSELMHYKADVQQKVERTMEENGNRGDCFSQVVNSNLPASFTLSIPIFKGMKAETLEIETFAQVDGRNVRFMLMSPGAEESLESIRDAAIDAELVEIREIAPDIVIIEK